MQKKLTRAQALIFLLLLSVPGLAQEQPAESDISSPVVVRVYDYAQVPSVTLAKAQEVAAEVFRKAGVEIVWVNCAVDENSSTSCSEVEAGSSLLLRITRRTKEARAAFQGTTTGYAVRSEKGGRFATVFYDQVIRVSEEWSVAEACALGHAVAHELGHLLLPTGDHTRRGLMRARLQRHEWELAGMGRLLFSSEQAEHLQAGALARRLTPPETSDEEAN
jgi:hypothetical protein